VEEVCALLNALVVVNAFIFLFDLFGRLSLLTDDNWKTTIFQKFINKRTPYEI